MMGIEPAFSAWELRFAPETRMNAGVGVPTMSAATALRQHNKVPAALAGFSLGSRRRRSAGRSCLRKSVTSTQTERWQPSRRRPAHHTKHQPTTSPATFTDLEPELGDIVKQLIDFVADSKMGVTSADRRQVHGTGSANLSGRLAGCAFVSTTECGFGCITETFGDQGDGQLLLAQEIGGDMHAPPRHVLHRSLTDQLAEPGRERRATHRDGGGERGNTPFLLRFTVDESHRSADLWVLQGAKPAGLRPDIGVEPTPNRTDHQDVAQAGDHRLAAWLRFGRLSGDHPEDARQPLECPSARRRSDMNHFGEHLDQASRRRVGESDRATDQVDAVASSTMTEDGVVGAEIVVREVHHWSWLEARIVGRMVPGAVRKDHEVAPPHLALHALAVDEEAVPRRHHVEPDAAGHRRQPERPWCAELGPTVEDALHPKELQRLGEWVGCRWNRGIGMGCHRRQSSVAVSAAVVANTTASTPSADRIVWRRFHGPS